METAGDRYATIEAREACRVRAARATGAVTAYADAYDVDEPTVSVLADLLADVMHLASLSGLNWDEIHETATINVEAERAGE